MRPLTTRVLKMINWPVLVWLTAFALLFVFTNSRAETDSEFTLTTTLEGRYFINDPAFAQQHEDENFSLALDPEYYIEWADGDQSFTAALFGRVDQNDDERTHADIRELFYRYVGDSTEWRVGIRRVFWGVTESVHLVDVINQDDLVENPDGEDKLGQPMVNLAWVTDYGNFDFFVLPYFRERTLPGEEGRLRGPIPFSQDDPVYEDSDEEQHVDAAVRWFHFIGGIDVALSYFDGTNRDPRFTFNADRFDVSGVPGPPLALGPIGALVDPAILIAIFGAPDLSAVRITPVNPVLIPVYEQMQQTGLELQYLNEGWFFKLEAIHRETELESYVAAAAGFEYTIGGIFGSAADLGIIGEYLYDDRGKIKSDSAQAAALRGFDRGFFTLQEATTLLTAGPDAFADQFSAADDDVFVGMRLALNDVQSTDFLGGVIIDSHDHSVLGSIEASRRLGASWKASLEMRWFTNIDVLSPLYGAAQDDYIQLELARYF